MLLRITCVLILCLAYQIGSAQVLEQKLEIETRINHNEIPENLKQVIIKLFGSQKGTKWYQESDGEVENFEAKLKFRKRRFSVEFDTLLQLKDVEVEYAFYRLSENLRNTIQTNLEADFENVKIKRVQLQLTGDTESFGAYVKSEITTNLTLRYEIEFIGKSNDSSFLYEALTDVDGNIIQIRVVVLPTSDNLTY